jgi:hypothetical protein
MQSILLHVCQSATPDECNHAADSQLDRRSASIAASLLC